jgi:SNF2 family DNA or RNA helicase
MFFHQQTKSLVLQADDPLSIRSALPRWSRIIDQTEQGNVQVRHNIETTRILRNMGYDAPSPMDCHYPWPGKYDPYDHQRVMADAMIMNNKVFNLSEMGTGKTYASLWAADYLMSQGLVKRVLILSPLSTLETVWKQDIFDILMHRSCAVIHGSMEKRLQRLNTDVDFYILNHDGIALPEVAKLIRRRTDIDLIICDEFHYFINNSTDKWKYLNWVMEKKDRLWGMTGTPTPNEPTDAWALCKLINPNAVPRFKGTFKRQTMIEIGKWKWAPRKGSERIVFDVMRPAVRFLKKDCLDLPEQIGPIKIQTRMTKAQEKAYNQMREDMILSGQGTTITAVNAADKITKLRQILCGVVKDPATGQYKFIDHHHRIDDLCATIDQAKAKVLVIVPFKGILRALDAELTKRGYSTAYINGDVSPGARNKIIRAFKTTDDPQVLLCHPMVMAHGLNLTVADMTIFYAPIYSNKDYQQVTERNNRAGQTRVTTVVRMGANPLEWQIYRQLDTKGVTQDNVLSLYHRIVGSG